MKNLFITENTPLIISQNETTPVKKALRDLKNDWYMVFGSFPLIYEKLPENINTPAIYIGSCVLEGLFSPAGRESFVLKEQEGNIYLCGADELGLIFAIYTFSEKVLGVDPWYYWNDFLPAKKEKIILEKGFDLSHGSPSFKFRGFFINNEDLVTGSFPDPLEENLMDLGTFDRICELILRLYGNMIVPGTRTYPDERVRDEANLRGLYINDHHVTPLGLNVYMWPEDIPYSYITHPEILEEMWGKCAEAEKGHKMLWTVSYRAKGDGQFWKEDPAAPETDEERAEVISRAIEKQVEIIRRVQPDAQIMYNAYNWNYETKLLAKGLIKVPEGVMRVWVNDGSSILPDASVTKTGDGLYLHITGCKNRFCEAVSPERIYTELGKFKRAGADGCVLLNIGNMRPFPIGITSAMNFAYNSDEYIDMEPRAAMERTILEYSKQHYDMYADEVSAIYTDFFGASNFREPCENMAPYGTGQQLNIMLSNPKFSRVLVDFRQNIYMHHIARQYIKVLKGEDSFAKVWADTVDDYNSILYEETAYLPELSRRAHALTEKIPARSQKLYKSNVLLQIDATNFLNIAMENEGLSVKAYIDGDIKMAKRYMERAVSSMKRMIDILHGEENEKWFVWYAYEALSCYWHTRDLLICVLSLLEGNGETPIRPFIDFGGHGKQIYYYQYPPQKDAFPLLKKH